MSSRRGGRAAAAALFTLVVAACGTGRDGGAGADGGVTSGPSSVPAHLAGRTFRSTGESGLGGTPLVLTFTDRALTARAGCNLLSGPARVESGHLVTGPLAQTEMGCAAPLMRQDEEVAAFLQGRPRVDVDAGTLSLASRQHTVRFEEDGADPRPLAGTSWRLDSVGDGAGPDGTTSSVPHGARTPGIRLAHGILSVRTGCSHGEATAAPRSGALGLGPVVLTTGSCPPPLDALERHTLAVLLPGATYVVDGAVLRVTSPDGRLRLDYRAD